MDEDTHPTIPILAVSWRRLAELEITARKKEAFQTRLQRWAVALGVAAILLAIVADHFSTGTSAWVGWTFKALLVLTSFLSAVLAAFIPRFSSRGDWLAMRRGAEQIRREIYVYRTIQAESIDRDAWLEARLNTIIQRVFKNAGHELSFQSYQGPLPPFRDPKRKDLDPGFKDLTGDEYTHYRLEHELAGTILKETGAENTRLRLQGALLTLGCAGLLLAAIGGSWMIWVALTASLVLAFSAGGALSQLDEDTKIFNRMILDLNELRDHWLNLPPEARKEGEFHQLVRSTEEVLLYREMGYLPSPTEEPVSSSAGSAAQPEQPGQASPASQPPAKRSEAEPERTSPATEKALPETPTSTTSLSQTIQKIALDFSDLDLTKETPKELLHKVIAQFPPSGEIKG